MDNVQMLLLEIGRLHMEIEERKAREAQLVRELQRLQPAVEGA